jgi:hypothetical protein
MNFGSSGGGGNVQDSVDAANGRIKGILFERASTVRSQPYE